MLSSVNVPLQNLVILFITIFSVGLLLTIPLFKFDLKKFYTSKLFIKILFWVPIFIIYLLALYAGNGGRLIIVGVIIIFSYLDYSESVKGMKSKLKPLTFFITYCIALLSLYFVGVLFSEQVVNILIAVCMSSVLADVFAFFMGNYLGRHKLPSFFNNKKSWEGVAGQIIGAFVGVALVKVIVEVDVSIYLFIPIGIGSAIGDLSNSYIKRIMGKKDWSNRIPGHGGFIDRLSSLGGSMALTVIWLLIVN